MLAREKDNSSAVTRTRLGSGHGRYRTTWLISEAVFPAAQQGVPTSVRRNRAVWAAEWRGIYPPRDQVAAQGAISSY
jgi:hypothetical protein